MGSARPPDTEVICDYFNDCCGSTTGRTLLEYAMLAALIAVAALGAVTLLGDHINKVFWAAIGPSI
jgi:Flp pilus assembly pilin Flp